MVNKTREATVLMELHRVTWERKKQTDEVTCLVGAKRELNRVRREWWGKGLSLKSPIATICALGLAFRIESI